MTDQMNQPHEPQIPTPPKTIHSMEGNFEVKEALPKDIVKKGLVKDMSEPKTNVQSLMVNMLLSLVVVAAGIGSGWGLSMVVAKPEGQTSEDKAMVDAGTIKPGDIYGNKEVNGYKDSAEGVLLKGGIDGEGSHRLLRTGGKSQTVYMTSSVIDLDPFVNHKVKIWGETFAAQKANWLMDVGRVEVVELNAQKPFEE